MLFVDCIVSHLMADYGNLVASVVDESALMTIKNSECVDCQCASNSEDLQDVKPLAEDGGKLPGDVDVWQSLFGRKFRLAVEKSLHDYTVFYIGCEGPVLTNFMMCMNKCQVSLNPMP